MTHRNYQRGATSWANSGRSPAQRTGGAPRPIDEWTQRDLAMMVALISGLQAIMRQASTFNSPQRRRGFSQIIRKTQDQLRAVQIGGRGLSANAREGTERLLRSFFLPVPARPLTPEGGGTFEINDGQPKPLKPPVRIKPEGDS